MCTYGDGSRTSTLDALVAFHKSHGKLATVTAVQPAGALRRAEARRRRGSPRFAEKPQAEAGWINGGFFVFEPGVCRLHRRRLTVSLERDVARARRRATGS